MSDRQKRGLSPDEDDVFITEESKRPRQEEGQVEGDVRQDDSQNTNNNPNPKFKPLETDNGIVMHTSSPIIISGDVYTQ